MRSPSTPFEANKEQTNWSQPHCFCESCCSNAKVHNHFTLSNMEQIYAPQMRDLTFVSPTTVCAIVLLPILPQPIDTSTCHVSV